jgi:hypothetical protein
MTIKKSITRAFALLAVVPIAIMLISTPGCTPVCDALCGGSAGTGGVGGGVVSEATQLTSHRTCNAANPCSGTGGIPPFACTVWDGCYTAGSAGVGHCKVKYASSLFKCVAGAKLPCTTNSGVNGVYTCSGPTDTPACDWPTDSCKKCGGTPSGAPEPCCVTGCNAGFVCGVGAMCTPI